MNSRGEDMYLEKNMRVQCWKIPNPEELGRGRKVQKNTYKAQVERQRVRGQHRVPEGECYGSDLECPSRASVLKA